MADEPRQFRLAAQAEDYALLPGARVDVHYASDDSDGPSIGRPSVPNDDDEIRAPRIPKAGPRLILERALIPHNHLSDTFDASALITGDDTTTYDAPEDRVPAEWAPKDILEDWDGWLIGHSIDPAHLRDIGGGGEFTGLYAESSPAFTRNEERSRIEEDRVRARTQRALRAEHTRRVSGAVDEAATDDITLSMVRLPSVGATRYISGRHSMILQAWLALPGFLPPVHHREMYVTEEETVQPYRVYIPYFHRRLWLLFLAAPSNAADWSDPHTLVAWRLGAIFEVALAVHKPGRHSVHSRAFARLVGHHLRCFDMRFRTLCSTVDIRFALGLFAHGRYRYLAARARDARAGLPLAHWYPGGGGVEAPRGCVLRKTQKLVERWIDRTMDEKRAEQRGVKVDPAVEREFCPESDDGEESEDEGIGPSGVWAELYSGRCPRFPFGPQDSDSDSDSSSNSDSDSDSDSEDDGDTSEAAAPEPVERRNGMLVIEAIQPPHNRSRAEMIQAIRDGNPIIRHAGTLVITNPSALQRIRQRIRQVQAAQRERNQHPQ